MDNVNDNLANKMKADNHARQVWQTRMAKRVTNAVVGIRRIKGGVTERGYKPTDAERAQVVGTLRMEIEALEAAWTPVNAKPGFSFEG